MPLPPVQPPVNPFRVFYLLTGVTFFAFVSGFSTCLFDLNQVSACVDYAEDALTIMQKAGDHIVNWFIKVVEEVFRRNPVEWR